MSRAGIPTDNVAMESINGWIKAELFMDFHVTGDKPVDQKIDDYIEFFNEQRQAYSPGYLTPKQYKDSFSPSVVWFFSITSPVFVDYCKWQPIFNK